MALAENIPDEIRIFNFRRLLEMYDIGTGDVLELIHSIDTAIENFFTVEKKPWGIQATPRQEIGKSGKIKIWGDNSTEGL
ncbi:hypothetical protein [Microbulbifer epialgicus]|uniref:Transposase domain n=1 Tax=Microbulbifer epialgicus TaxID=393907 RepID=A0ABV4NU35_9GAMM